MSFATRTAALSPLPHSPSKTGVNALMLGEGRRAAAGRGLLFTSPSPALAALGHPLPASRVERKEGEIRA